MHPALKRPLQHLNNFDSVPLHNIQRWLKQNIPSPTSPNSILDTLHTYVNQHPDYDLRNSYHLCMSYASRENLTTHKRTPKLFALNLLIRCPSLLSPTTHSSSQYVATVIANHISQHLPSHITSSPLELAESITVLPALLRTEDLTNTPPSQLFALFHDLQLWTLNATPEPLKTILKSRTHSPLAPPISPTPNHPTDEKQTASAFDDYTLFFSINTDETIANAIEDCFLSGKLLNSELTLFTSDQHGNHHALNAHIADASTAWNISQTGAYSALCLHVISSLQYFDPRTPEGAISCAFFYPPDAIHPSVRFAQSSNSTLFPGPTYHNVLQPDKLVEKLYICTRTHQLHDPIICPYIPAQPLSDHCFYSKSTWVTVSPSA